MQRGLDEVLWWRVGARGVGCEPCCDAGEGEEEVFAGGGPGLRVGVGCEVWRWWWGPGRGVGREGGVGCWEGGGECEVEVGDFGGDGWEVVDGWCCCAG